MERGTPPRRSSKGKAPGYSPKRGEAVYKAHRANSCKPRKADSCKPFIAWVVKQVREHKWPLNACCGYAKRQCLCLFSESEMVCTHTLYNMVWDGLLPIKATELPETLERKGRRSRDREHKKCYGTSSSDRPEIAAQRMEEGHWEGGTMVGKRAGHEAVVLTLLEKRRRTTLPSASPARPARP